MIKIVTIIFIILLNVMFFLDATCQTKAYSKPLVVKTRKYALPNLYVTMMEMDQCDHFLSLVNITPMGNELRDGKQYTVFAFSDIAYSKMPAKTQGKLEENDELVKTFIYQYIVKGSINPTEALKMKTVKTMNGNTLTLSSKAGKLCVNGVPTIQGAVRTSNGYLYVTNSPFIKKEKK